MGMERGTYGSCALSFRDEESEVARGGDGDGDAGRDGFMSSFVATFAFLVLVFFDIVPVIFSSLTMSSSPTPESTLFLRFSLFFVICGVGKCIVKQFHPWDYPCLYVFAMSMQMLEDVSSADFR